MNKLLRINNYLMNILKILCWKVCFTKKIKNWFLFNLLKKVRFDIAGKSSVNIGICNQNREKLYIGVNNGQLTIGNHCFFNINCSITCLKKITIGNNCKFGNNVVIVDHDHNFITQNPEFVSDSIKIGNNVWVGANVTILRNTVIGDNCVIGAGSVIKGTIGPNHLVIGNIHNKKIIR
ncbi:acyltransferase [Sporolactobacillus inulinus]|nr:acyltransferase [Sporolactobacillus inulinus]